MPPYLAALFPNFLVRLATFFSSFFTTLSSFFTSFSSDFCALKASLKPALEIGVGDRGLLKFGMNSGASGFNVEPFGLLETAGI